jgi:predicted AlkP superfamily pyrophosphatase or phosphodiesterase
MKIIVSAISLFFATTVISQKAVFIIADGIPADVLENTKAPNIQKITKLGAYTRAHVGGDKGTYNQTPTISAVGYNSLLTGTWVNKHNVWGNDIKEPNYHYPTIFKIFKEQFPSKRIAVFSSWIDNRIKLVGDDLEQTNYLKVDEHADGFELDTLQFPHDKQGNYMHLIDEKVITAAAKSIQTQAPDLSWIYLEYTDDMGHKFGDSPEFTNAIELLDKQIGKIYEAIEYRQKKFNEKWLIIITTDHGRDEKTGRNHGGQTFRQRSTWIASNVQLNNYAKYNYPAIVDIMPTLARFLHVELNDSLTKEIDGIALIQPVSVAQPEVNVFQNKLDVSWQCLDTTGTATIWLTTTNNFAVGKKDNYVLLKKVPVSQKNVTIDISQYPSDFYKIAIEGKYNTTNKWLSNK